MNHAYDGTKLPCSTPEAAGVPSEAVLDFLEQLSKHDVPMHGFLAIRGGKQIAEGYWKPFRGDELHRMYSAGKSFVSIAVGFLESEGLISLDDAIMSHFPEKLPEGGVHPYIAEMTIRDMLMMASAHEKTTYKQMDLEDWVRTFFVCPPSHIPGTVFCYDTSASLVLTALVEKKAGMTFLDYLRPRLLDPLGFSKDAYCIKDPTGSVSQGGSGLLCTLSDLAKVAFVCMRGGVWNGEQLIPRDYIRAATSRQISNFVAKTHMDCDHGYGYQFWCYPGGVFAFFGMGGQLAICFPEQDFLVATVADAQMMKGEAELVYGIARDTFLPRMSEGEALPADPAAYDRLQGEIEALSFITVRGSFHSALIPELQGKTYRLDPSCLGWESFSLSFAESGGTLSFMKHAKPYAISFGYGENVPGVFPEFGAGCLASAAWWNDSTLNIACYITGAYLAPLRITVSFKGAAAVIQMQNAAELFIEDYSGIASGRQE